MVKQMISFTEPQWAWLKAEAARLGVSLAELVRRAVDQHRTSGIRSRSSAPAGRTR